MTGGIVLGTMVQTDLSRCPAPRQEKSWEETVRAQAHQPTCHFIIAANFNPFLPEDLQHLSHPSKVNEVCDLKHLTTANSGRYIIYLIPDTGHFRPEKWGRGVLAPKYSRLHSLQHLSPPTQVKFGR